MDAILGFALKLFGVDFDKVNGWKTYAGGLTEFLTGLAAVIGASANVVGELVKLTTAGDYVGWVLKAAHGQDPACLALLAGVGIIGKGLADIGLAHKHDKLMEAMPSEAQAQTPPAGT